MFAFVTLLTSDSYLPGALVLCESLKNTGTRHDIVILCTPNLSEKTYDTLSHSFPKVIKVNMIDSKDDHNLKILGRPELGITFTKIHIFNPNLLNYEKVCFLDADIMVISNIDMIFDYVADERVLFAAAPDVGWPDCFNSGVFVTKPNKAIFEDLFQRSLKNESFDGGDQGLLNQYFSSWAEDSNNVTKKLPFTYNVTKTSFYSYLPALIKFAKDIKVIHFIGMYLKLNGR
jgi:alpha-N-acetylglucosamine transferase